MVAHLEFYLVQAAVFTEPTDQSPWLFYRWLLQQRQCTTMDLSDGVQLLAS